MDYCANEQDFETLIHDLQQEKDDDIFRRAMHTLRGPILRRPSLADTSDVVSGLARSSLRPLSHSTPGNAGSHFVSKVASAGARALPVTGALSGLVWAIPR